VHQQNLRFEQPLVMYVQLYSRAYDIFLFIIINFADCYFRIMSNQLLIDKLKGVNKRFEELSDLISDPKTIADMKRYVQLNREYRQLEPIVGKLKEYENVVNNLRSARDILQNEKDEELREMAKFEIDELEEKIVPLEDEIKVLLLPSDPEDDKNAVVEIRAGTGGDEASIFAGDLYRMYTKFFETKGWKAEVSSSSEGTMGGFKEVIIHVNGPGVYGLMKYESGVHRVQRVPQTETQGRVHTSAASVAVLPEADEFDVELKSDEIRKDTYCSSGPGGQSVNTTYSAIRLTHIPSGLVVTCQDEKSQIKNLEKAMKELRTRLYNLEYQKRMDAEASRRKTMVSTGDRSAKIRTYNYPQGRMTDHRIGLTIYNLPVILDGEIGDIISQLQMAENAEKLKESGI
jgi:peptide chain release factor 1